MRRIISLTLTVIIIISCMPHIVYAQRSIAQEEVLAQELKELGLFRGVSDTDFDLDRAPSRVEALVMLIRVLGKESEVTSGVWRHPFTDVPDWANKYVGYAYSNGLTNGQSTTEFGNGDANAAMFITFVLRALGYSDANGADFVWNDPFALARMVGILPETVNIEEFWRADVVLVAHASLAAYLKGSNQTLAQKLIASGVFTQAKFNLFYGTSDGTSPIQQPTVTELTAEQIYAYCSPAVFYIEVYDGAGKVVSSGSGFFVDDQGTAVTNYHVIDGASFIKAQMSDNGEIYDIVGIYDYSLENDWAVVKVNCTGNKFLTIGDSSTIVGASTVYTIGSPLGLQNTISQGLVSNPKRVEDGVTYIQISAAISHGSSGGALLNKYGQVIGITSAGYTEGQNLNLAIPMSALDGYSANKLTSFEFLRLSGVVDATVDINSRQEVAFSLLKTFILNNYQSTSESLGMCYTEAVRTKDGKNLYSIFYDAEEDSITLNVTHEYSKESRYNFFAAFKKDTKLLWFFGYYLSAYDGNKYVSVAEGFGDIYIFAFNKSSVLKFTDKYEGGDEEDLILDQKIAAAMLCEGLDFMNLIFQKHLSAFGNYSVEDFGYTSYDANAVPDITS